MSDIITRLRALADSPSPDRHLARQAADELERRQRYSKAWSKAVLDNCDRETAKEIFAAQGRAFDELSR